MRAGVGRSGRAGGAPAPEHDLRLVDHEAVVVGGGQAGRGADGAVDVGDGAAGAAHHVVVVVADAQLVARGRAGRLDPAYDARPRSARAARRRRPGGRHRPLPARSRPITASVSTCGWSCSADRTARRGRVTRSEAARRTRLEVRLWHASDPRSVLWTRSRTRGRSGAESPSGGVRVPRRVSRTTGRRCPSLDGMLDLPPGPGHAPRPRPRGTGRRRGDPGQRPVERAGPRALAEVDDPPCATSPTGCGTLMQGGKRLRAAFCLWGARGRRRPARHVVPGPRRPRPRWSCSTSPPSSTTT